MRAAVPVAALAAVLYAAYPAAQGDVTPPGVAAQSPSPGATGVSTRIAVKAAFSEPIQPATLVFQLRNSSNSIVPATFTYDDVSRTATLTPVSELAGSQTFTALASGARDLAGNLMTPISWSFTTSTAGFQDIVLPQTGLVDPTVIQFASDGGVFVAEKSGRVHVFDSLQDPEPHPGDRSPDERPQLLGSRHARDGPSSEFPRDSVHLRALCVRCGARRHASRNCIWAMRLGSGGQPNPADIVTIRAGAADPVHLVSGPNGEVFYAGLNDDRLHRIRYSAGNLAPTAVAEAVPTEGAVPLQVTFNASKSSDPEGQTLTYAWDLDGDGQFDDSTAVNPVYTYMADGGVTARVRVTDPGGLSDVGAVMVWPGNTAPVARIDSPAPTVTWKVGDVIAFSGSATDREDGNLPASAFEWTLIMHPCPSNCHAHDIQTIAGVSSGSFVAPDHEYPSHLELRLTVTDSGDVTHSTSVTLNPRTVSLTFNTSPAGLRLSVNGSSATAPFSRTVIVGSSNSVAAPTPHPLRTGRTP